MKKILALLFLNVTAYVLVYSQVKFDTIAWVRHTSIKDQQNSGTCWSFATTSFIESEIIRQNTNIKEIDLSEMFFVYHNYQNKFQRYFLMSGYMFWTPGGQPHDVMNIVRCCGFVPEDAYKAYTAPNKGHNHEKLDTALSRFVRALNFFGNYDKYKQEFKDSLNKYLGQLPDSFLFEKKYYKPTDFCKKYNFNADDYITLTSLSHHPYYKYFVLEDKFNWASELYYNVPWDIFETICDSALIKGYSIVWDGDVSDFSGFDYIGGYARLLKKYTNIEADRKRDFFTHKSKIDHVMHIVGIVRKNNEQFYVVKNSWGKVGKFKGYILMTREYFRQKTIAVMLHKNAVEWKLGKL